MLRDCDKNWERSTATFSGSTASRSTLHDQRASAVSVCISTFEGWCVLIVPTAVDTAQAFWGLLLPHGLQGGALQHVHATDDDEDDDMGEEEGWKEEYVQWWFEFLLEKGGKGVSKDTWAMVSSAARFGNWRTLTE